MDKSVISLIDDEEDEDLKLAISLSLQQQSNTVQEPSTLHFNKLPNTTSKSATSFRDLIGKVYHNSISCSTYSGSTKRFIYRIHLRYGMASKRTTFFCHFYSCTTLGKA